MGPASTLRHTEPPAWLAGPGTQSIWAGMGSGAGSGAGRCRMRVGDDVFLAFHWESSYPMETVRWHPRSSTPAFTSWGAGEGVCRPLLWQQCRGWGRAAGPATQNGTPPGVGDSQTRALPETGKLLSSFGPVTGSRGSVRFDDLGLLRGRETTGSSPVLICPGLFL